MKILMFLFLITFNTLSFSKENIFIYSPYSPGHSGHVVLDKVLKEANKQNIFNFLIVTKPGGQGLVALREIQKNKNSLAIIHAAVVEHIEKNIFKKEDFVPVYSIGEACWGVVSLNGNEYEGIKSLKGTQEITVGTVGNGNSTHLTALEIGEKYNIPVRLIIFKSNQEALINMVGNNGINFTIERIVTIENFKNKNDNLKILGVTCNKSIKGKEYIKPLKEQDINVPSIFNLIVASNEMDKDKIIKIKNILNNVTKELGLESLLKLSDMKSSIFDNISEDEFYFNRIEIFLHLRNKHKNIINSIKQ